MTSMESSKLSAMTSMENSKLSAMTSMESSKLSATTKGRSARRKANKTITALESCDSKAVTYMIRGKMMSIFFVSVFSTDLQIYFITP